MTEQVKTAGEPLIRIVHPSDFSASSRVAFAHALKIALQSNAELELVHVQRHEIGSEKDVHWTDFPGVRATLARWKILPADAKPQDVASLGLRVKKVLNSETDPLEAMITYCEEYPPDLLVLATHQRDGLSRWLHKAVAEPLARRSRAMTLFVPESAGGFVSPANGAVTLRRILIPVDHAPRNAKLCARKSRQREFGAIALQSKNRVRIPTVPRETIKARAERGRRRPCCDFAGIRVNGLERVVAVSRFRY